MKGVNFSGVRGRQFFLTLVTFICTTILIWAWDKSSLGTKFLRQQEILGGHRSAVPSGIAFADYDPAHTALPEKSRSHHNTIDVGIAQSNVAAIEDADSEIDRQHNKDCNYAKGKWVRDEGRPLYSGFECKQWLSEMWACRMTDRLDFSFESFRWKPKGCKMPDFSGSSFLERTRDKTVAFVGDSLGRQQFQSLMSMVTGGKIDLDVKDVGTEYGLVIAPGALRPDGWVYRFPDTNTTILYYWSASLCDLVPLNISNPTGSIAMHLDRPTSFLQQYIHRFDVLVLNTGHHWNRGKLKANRWQMYVGGNPINDSDLAIENAKNVTIYSVASWVDLQLAKYPRLKAFFRTISPRHFVNGDWNSGGSCNNTIPLSHSSEVLQEGSSDSVVEGALKGTRVKILDITALSQLRDEGHISMYSLKGITKMQDCLHWCLPGIPDAWNEILFAQI